MIISILNQKGGCGKTTLAVSIARALTRNGLKTLLVDSDSQGSAQHWHQRSGGELIDMTCLFMTTLEKDIQKYVNIYDRIIIDGVPRISPITMCAITCSDKVFIPVQPSPYDIWATEELLRSVKDRIVITNGKLKAGFIVSRKIVGTNMGKEVEAELSKMELASLRHGTCQRVAYATSVRDGLTVLDGEYYGTEACKEIEQITQEIEEW
jgi:chromosome partitioning protein